MKNIICQFLFVVLFFTSCENGIDHVTYPEGANILTIIEEDRAKYNEHQFLIDTEVETLIKANNAIFMSSFWIGMTEDQTIEIIRYLLDKGEISGTMFNSISQTDEVLTTKNLTNLEINNNIRTLNCNLTPNTKTIQCVIRLFFRENINSKNLDHISVAALEDIEFSDFEDFYNLFTIKYGTPERIKPHPAFKSFPKGDIYKQYGFERGNTKIQITYDSKHDVNGLTAPNQIHIVYQDLIIDQQHHEDAQKQLKIEDEKNDKLKEKSLENI